jgi:hypothetical protein
MKDIAIKIGKELKEKLTLKQRKMSQCGENVLRMREDDFNTLSETQRDLFTYVEKVEINEQ